MGSEMCIRDSPTAAHRLVAGGATRTHGSPPSPSPLAIGNAVERGVAQPLSQKVRFDSNQNKEPRWLRKTVGKPPASSSRSGYRMKLRPIAVEKSAPGCCWKISQGPSPWPQLTYVRACRPARGTTCSAQLNLNTPYPLNERVKLAIKRQAMPIVKNRLVSCGALACRCLKL